MKIRIEGATFLDKKMAVIRADLNKVLLSLPVHGHTRNAIKRRVEKLAQLAAMRARYSKPQETR